MAYYVGQTIRVTASSIVDAAGNALVSPTVVFTVTKPDGTVVTPSTVTAGSTYYAEFTSAVAGAHAVRITATAGGGVWKDEQVVYIHDFS